MVAVLKRERALHEPARCGRIASFVASRGSTSVLVLVAVVFATGTSLGCIGGRIRIRL
jgi:hypothetical protein